MEGGSSNPSIPLFRICSNLPGNQGEEEERVPSAGRSLLKTIFTDTFVSVSPHTYLNKYTFKDF
jgi:hypothetical protein